MFGYLQFAGWHLCEKRFYILLFTLYKHENINFEWISVQLGVLMGTFAVSVQGRPFISILSR